MKIEFYSQYYVIGQTRWTGPVLGLGAGELVLIVLGISFACKNNVLLLLHFIYHLELPSRKQNNSSNTCSVMTSLKRYL